MAENQELSLVPLDQEEVKKEQGEFDKLISALIPIKDLPADLQTKVIKEGEIIEFKKGEEIFRAGSADDFLFYCLKGEVELISADDSNIRQAIVGGTGNAKYILAQIQPRRFSAKAKTSASLLKLHKACISP